MIDEYLYRLAIYEAKIQEAEDAGERIWAEWMLKRDYYKKLIEVVLENEMDAL